MREGDFAGALESFARLKQDSPDDPRGYFFSGIALAKLGRAREAAAQFASAVELDPDRLDYRLAAASNLADLGQLPSALQVLAPIDGERLGQQTSPPALWLLADLYYRSERNNDALRVLRRSLQIQPDNPLIHSRMGQIHLLEGRFDEAAEAFRSAIEASSGFAPAHHGLGLALWRMDRLQEARDALQTAVNLEPANPDHLLDLGRLALQTGSPSEALDYLKRAERLEGVPPEVHYEIARAYRRLGNRQLAAQSMAKFQSFETERKQGQAKQRRVDGLVKTGQDRLKAGSVKQAHEAFLEAVREDPDNWIAHSYLAKIYLSSNRLQDAESHLVQMQRIDPESTEGNYLLANCLYRRNEFERARVFAEKARRSRPDYADLRNLLGNIYFSLGRRRDAVEEYQAAMRLEPDREEFRLNYEAARKKNE